MAAPERFVQWLAKHEHRDPKYGFVYQYHPRSDAHSVALCEMVLEDILAACPLLLGRAHSGSVVYGINYRHVFAMTKKKKNLDLAIGAGVPDTTAESVGGIYKGEISALQIACECKTVMTEHSKSQPRVFDELSSSHEIVHAGDGANVIAAGITVVNMAATFVSPTRQKSVEVHVSKHKQPQAAQKMVTHLHGLSVRDGMEGVGFDAYANVVVICDNQNPPSLHLGSPAPQPGDRDEYAVFIKRISKAYVNRFGE